MSPQEKRTGNHNPAYQDHALFIAGIRNPQGSLANYEIRPEWTRYAKFMDQNWERFDKRLGLMRDWISREVTPAISSPVTAFYPFSGPDFVNLFTFYPQAKTYIMLALEPVGEIPDFSVPADWRFFGALQRSLYDLLQLNFFCTKKMAVTMRVKELKGVLPVLMFFMARENLHVLDVQYVTLKPDGALEEVPALERRPPPQSKGIPGVRLVFARPGAAENQTLYYFCFNLSNDSLERTRHFVSFLRSFGPMATFLKAASYLMFKPYFSGVRQFILDQSHYVVQNDSGVPLRGFEPSAWTFKFYGTYRAPIPLFSNCYQGDLAKVYMVKKDIQPLPFGIGYRHRLGTSNLMFASKKEKGLLGEPKKPGI